MGIFKDTANVWGEVLKPAIDLAKEGKRQLTTGWGKAIADNLVGSKKKTYTVKHVHIYKNKKK